MKIIELYAGKVRPFGPRGKGSAISKTPVSEAKVNELGMLEDDQGDKRFHGGVEKALHHYSLSGYEKMMKHYPLFHKKFKPGVLGENITSDTLHDKNVCIGDIFQIGEVKVQVSSPRIPCWKIAHKMEIADLDKFISKHGITGWYYRILEQGTLKTGDEITLLAQPNPELSIYTFMKVVNGDIDASEKIKHAAQAEGLDPEWKDRLERRIHAKNQESGDYTV